jgi:hypothetical protein
LSAKCFAQAIALDAVGHEFQTDELVDLLGCLEIEVLQDVMQKDACPKATLKSREIVYSSWDLDGRFDWPDGIAIWSFCCFFGASGGQPGETRLAII